MSRRFVCVWLVALCGWLTTAVPRVPGELRLFAPASYDVETTVLLNDVARKDKEVGYKIKATLDVAPVWSHQQTEFLLQFQLISPKLYLRGKHILADFMPYDSVWDSHADSTFYAHWKNGLIKTAYLDPNEVVDVVNYKKSLASLFQFQVLDGEYNETDVSGPCTVLYETVSINVFRKIKRSCLADSSEAVSGARRVARYSLSAALDALDELYADELLALGPAGPGLKARAWLRLARRGPAPAPAPLAGADVAAALRALPAALRPQPLELAPAPADADEERLDDEELVDALAAMDAALAGADSQDADFEAQDEGAEPPAEGAEPQDAGAAAATLLRVLGTLRALSGARVSALLARADVHPHLSSLCRALGLAGTRAAHVALADFLALADRDPLLPLARDYLDALALSHRPDDWVVLEVLRLGEEARSPDVAEAALLSAAAAAARLERARDPPAPPAPAAAALAQTVRDAVARSLARCKEERCRAVRLQALGNLRRADAADPLLAAAARGGGAAEPRASLAALEALGAVPPAALTFARLERLEALALDPRAPLEVGAAALDLLVRRRAEVPAPLAGAARVLYERRGAAAHELRRVLWQRLAALAPHYDELRRLPAMLEPDLRGWDARAHAGTSSVLVRPTGWAGAGWRGELESVQVARGGLLRRGAVTLRAVAPDAPDEDLLSVHVWTRGLEAFGGADGADDDDADPATPEEAAGGLALTVAGARMRDISLFDGQAELLGHVWAGTASAPTAVLRALRPLRDARASVPLLGGARLAVRAAAALALALDAHAQVSLWHRSARAALELRAGAAALVTADLRLAWGRVGARASEAAAPRLAIGADLDFHSRVALCVRARTAGLARARRVLLHSSQGARRLSVRRRRAAVTRAPGRTLALGRPNDHTCRTLLSAEPAA